MRKVIKCIEIKYNVWRSVMLYALTILVFSIFTMYVDSKINIQLLCNQVLMAILFK